MTTILLAAQAAQQGGSMSGMLIMMVAIFAIMYFLMIRPQQKQQKKIREFQNSLEKGSKVLVGGGIHGTVRSVDLAAGTIDVDIASGTVITVEKTSVFASAQDATGTKA